MAKEEAIPKWMIGLLVGLVIPIGGACYIAGRLSSRTSALEGTVGRHDEVIIELSSVTATLSTQINNHYTDIRNDVSGLQKNMASLQQETNKNIGTMIAAMTSLQSDVNDLKTSIQQLSEQ